MRILVLSAYDAASHRRWWRQLVDGLPEHHWHVETLPPRHFLWRVRGNALTWSQGAARAVLDAGWDLLLCTSSVDLSTLRGLVPALARVPTVLYVHENQLAYPSRTRAGPDANLAMLDLYGMLAADAVWFNSAFNRDSLFDGLDALLRRLPDGVPPGVLDRTAGKARVVPVPIEDRCFDARQRPPDGPLQVLWNHRWEFDKAPERCFAALDHLVADGVDFHVHVVGQRFRDVPGVFEGGRARLGHRARTWGFVSDRAAYDALLRRCDVVVSTAIHEFQGLSVLEAVAAGCHAAVPDRLAYREVLPPASRYPGGDADADVAGLAAMLTRMATDLPRLRATPAPDVSRFAWAALRDAYALGLEEASGRRFLR